MWTDVVDLRDFYDSTLGGVARRLLRGRLRAMWPDVRGQRVLGLGFATPFLGPFRGEAERVIAVMPASQGVLPWPPETERLTVLSNESELPLADRSVDRLLVVHALESCEQVRAMMRELWRVLADGGRLVVVVPNRRGLWARFEHTPFAVGRPYSRGQLAALLRDSMFTPVSFAGALFVPPVRSRLLLASAPAWDKVGARWFSTFAGVVIVESVKQIYAAASPQTAPGRTRRAYLPLPGGLGVPSTRVREERRAMV